LINSFTEILDRFLASWTQGLRLWQTGRVGTIRKQNGHWPSHCCVAALPRPVCQSH